MIAEERFAKMLEYLDQYGAAKITELAERFGVSEMTVHRDLQRAVSLGLIDKVHGGAVSKRVTEIPYRARGIHHQQEKQAIALQALTLIKPGMTIFLTPGTTVTEFARVLPETGLKVITNSLPIAQELTNRTQDEIISTGGTVRRHAEALVGPAAEAMPTDHFVHLAFIAVTGVDLDKGLSVYSEAEARVLRAVIKASRKTVLLNDSTKYDQVMGPVVAPLYSIHHVVSDASVPAKYRRYFENHDIHLDVVKPSPQRETMNHA